MDITNAHVILFEHSDPSKSIEVRCLIYFENDAEEFFVRGQENLCKILEGCPEEKLAAGSTVNWAFGYSEFHYILDGKAEMSYKLGPLYVEEKTVTVEKGDIYLIPKGAVIRWKIDPSGPLKKMCVIIPGARVDLWFKDIPEDVVKRLYKTGIDGKYE